MALHFTTTQEAATLQGVKMGVHARSGMGKTYIIRTLHEHPLTGPTLIINAESGVLSLRDVVIPTITLHSIPEMQEAYNFIAYSEHARQFKSIALDSCSEIAEVCLGEEKGKSKDPRKAYGEMGDEMRRLIRLYRDIPGKHVYFSFKQEYNKDEVTGIQKYGPSMPGQSLTKDIPYFFDELFCLDMGKTQDGRSFRYLRTSADLQYEAKDRSGALDQFEEPHLGKVVEKILSAAKR